jgi:mono/diheme cytochrome c family protein
MNKKAVFFGAIAIILVLLYQWLFNMPSVPQEIQLSESPDAIERGAYLFTAGGCISCHRDENNPELLTGGLALETDFGTFFAPNITPDTETGIGDWQAQDFLLALKHGRSPDGSFYYPAFPYRAYAGLSDQDAVDIGSYLMSLDPISSEVQSAEVPGWLKRWTIAGWNKLADLNQLPLDTEFDNELVARGAYLVRSVGHCGECHTPRNSLGIPDTSQEFAGAEIGEDTIEAINAEALDEWTVNNVDLFLLLGLKPDGEFVGGDMNEVIEHNTSKISDEDRDAIAAFLKRHDDEE